MAPARMILALAISLLLVDSYPTNIGCDFKVVPGKASAGLNVMTTTGNIMGAPPTDSANLASASTNQFNLGSSVTITFGSAFGMGFAHATAGTFTAPQFSGTPAAGASTCQGSQSIRYKGTFGPTNSIVWNAPTDVSALTTVTLSFAGAAGFGSVSRRSLTLTKSAAGSVTVSTSTTKTATGSTTTTSSSSIAQYEKINNGTCASNGMLPIQEVGACEAAARALQLSDVTATLTSNTPLPEACYYSGNQLYLPTNPANAGKGAAAQYELLCLKVVTTTTTTTTLLSTSRTSPQGIVSTSPTTVRLDQYVKIASGTCSSNQMDRITDSTTCDVAVEALGLSVTVAEVTVTSVTPAPEACWYYQDRLYFSVNSANLGNGASPPDYEGICLKRALGPVGAASSPPSSSDTNLVRPWCFAWVVFVHTAAELQKL